MKLTPGRARDLALWLAVLCLVILLGIGLAVWWVDRLAGRDRQGAGHRAPSWPILPWHRPSALGAKDGFDRYEPIQEGATTLAQRRMTIQSATRSSPTV
jgi:hypothetical protein